MKSTDLTVPQLKRLQGSLRPKLTYLTKLRFRMEQTAFPEHDRLLRDTRIAETVLKDLVSEVETLLNYKNPTHQAFG